MESKAEYSVSSKAEKKNLFRLGIENAASVLFGGSNRDGRALATFLLALRSLLRSRLGVCMLSVDDSDLSEAGLSRVSECCDLVVSLKSFGASEGDHGGFKDKHGFLEVRKGCTFNALDWTRHRHRFVFKSLRGRMAVEKMHLPPELEKEEEKGGNKSKKKVDKKDLEF